MKTGIGTIRARRDAVAYAPPGSRADPADFERAERSWRDFCARIDAEEAARAKRERAA